MLSLKDFAALTADDIARLARDAAILEVSVSPKPGLVCPDTPGAHRDMDYHTFIASALSLRSYFEICVHIGIEQAQDSAKERFATLRKAGVTAEQTMFAATGGINTHKGLIFSLGIVCCAAGTQQVRLKNAKAFDAGQKFAALLQAICGEAAKMIEGIVARELEHVAVKLPERALTAGEKIYLEHGITGIRGEAQAGFPHVIGAYAHLQEALKECAWNDACCQTLLYLIVHTKDTNVVHRRGLMGLETLQKGAGELFAQGISDGGRRYRDFCAESTRQNLSPGGCADLLALAIFFYLLFYGRA